MLKLRKFAILSACLVLLSISSVADVSSISKLVTDDTHLKASVNLARGTSLRITAGGATRDGGYYYASTSVSPFPAGGGYASQGMFFDWRPNSVKSYVNAAAMVLTDGSKVGYDIIPTQGIQAHADVQ